MNAEDLECKEERGRDEERERGRDGRRGQGLEANYVNRTGSEIAILTSTRSRRG